MFSTKFSIYATAGDVVAQLLSNDPENDALTYTVGGTDAALFTVSGSQLVVAAGVTSLGSGSLSITLTATDRSGAAGSQSTTSSAITLTESCV